MNTGERIILTCSDPALDGRRGKIVEVHPCDTYAVRLDEGIVLEWVGGSRLEREASYPDYPLPQKVDAETGS